MTDAPQPEANLLPCPLDQGKAALTIYGGDERNGYAQTATIKCAKCGLSMSCTDEHPTKPPYYAKAGTGKTNAITAWNTRPQEAPASASDLVVKLRERARNKREDGQGFDARCLDHAADALASQAAEIADRDAQIETLADAIARIAYEEPAEPWRVAHDALKATARAFLATNQKETGSAD